MADSFHSQTAGETGGNRSFLPSAVEVKTWESSSLPSVGSTPNSLDEFHA